MLRRFTPAPLSFLLLPLAAGCPWPSSTCGEGVAAVVGDEGWTSIQAAIDAAPDGGTVTVCPGTWRENLSTHRDLVLESAEGAEVTTLDGGETSALVVYGGADLTVRGLTFAGGAGMRPGFRDSWRAGGGVFAWYAGDVLVESSVFRDHDSGSASALLAEATTSLTLRDTAFLDGRARWFGGGLVAELVDAVDLDGVTFTGNRTASQAGAFALFGVPSCTLTDLLIEGNGATEAGIYTAGGGALLAGSSCTITHSTFTGNDAYDGAALSLEQSDVTMSGVEIRDNTAEGWGGGILAIAYGGDSHVTADATTVVSDNHADAGYGGGLSAYTIGDGSRVLVQGLALTGNTALAGGGVATFDEGGLAGLGMSGGTIDGNTAEYGGGLFLPTPATIDASAVRSNAATSGGGAWLEGAATLVSTGTTWGGTGQENLPEDLVVAGVSLAAPGTDFTCDAATAACSP